MALELRELQQYSATPSGLTLKDWGATDAGQLCLHFELKLAVGCFEGVLVYPDLFPDVPAYIRPKKPGELWSHHQYAGSGVLCLEYGPDNWRPEITGAQLIQSARVLLWGELFNVLKPKTEHVPSRHVSTTGQEQRGNFSRYLVTPHFMQVLSSSSTGSLVEIGATVTYLGRDGMLIPSSYGNPPVSIPDVPKALTKEGKQLLGWGVRVDSVEALGPLKAVSALHLALAPYSPQDLTNETDERVVILHDDTGAMRLFQVRGGPSPYSVEHHRLNSIPDSCERLPSEFTKLAGVTVALVGLGSLGSKIAVSLARAGVRQFILVDDDVLAPENLVRNELNWRDVGFLKVEAVARELNHVAAGVEVATATIRVAGQENPMLAALLSERLSNCSLVIDATANTTAFVALAAMAKRGRTPLVWGEIFGGGTGCLMARSRPGLDADPLSVRAHIHSAMDAMKPVPEGKSKRYGLEAEDQVYVASDADVTSLAASMTQFSLDLLCAGAESAYPVAAYLIGFRKYWEFRGPFDTIPIDCSSALRPEVEPDCLSADELSVLEDLKKALEACGRAADNSAV